MNGYKELVESIVKFTVYNMSPINVKQYGFPVYRVHLLTVISSIGRELKDGNFDWEFDIDGVCYRAFRDGSGWMTIFKKEDFDKSLVS